MPNTWLTGAENLRCADCCVAISALVHPLAFLQESRVECRCIDRRVNEAAAFILMC